MEDSFMENIIKQIAEENGWVTVPFYSPLHGEDVLLYMEQEDADMANEVIQEGYHFSAEYIDSTNCSLLTCYVDDTEEVVATEMSKPAGEGFYDSMVKIVKKGYEIMKARQT